MARIVIIDLADPVKPHNISTSVHAPKKRTKQPATILGTARHGGFRNIRGEIGSFPQQNQPKGQSLSYQTTAAWGRELGRCATCNGTRGIVVGPSFRDQHRGFETRRPVQYHRSHKAAWRCTRDRSEVVCRLGGRLGSN